MKYLIFKFPVVQILIIWLLIISPILASASSSYWDIQRKGANIFSQQVTEQTWQDAANVGIKLVRLAPDKWSTKHKDFLIGDADHYTGLVAEDLIQLQQALGEANRYNVKVVLTMLSLPGNRWKQLNHNQNDSRLWQDENFQQQAIQFWRDLAKSLRGNAAIVGYNIINEPHPEITYGYHDFATQNYQKFAAQVAGTPADLHLFYQRVVDAIREVDATTPIILDTGMYADPRAFSYFKPVHGNNILYAFHMYEPQEYTNKKLNNGQYTYPDKIQIGSNPNKIYLDKNWLQATYFQSVINWQKQFHIPSSRILVGEFGGNRETKQLDRYFNDLITIFNQNGWHWAFYAFREDTWPGMDYELGAKPVGADYWKAKERGEHPQLKKIPNPIWQVIKTQISLYEHYNPPSWQDNTIVAFNSKSTCRYPAVRIMYLKRINLYPLTISSLLASG